MKVDVHPLFAVPFGSIVHPAPDALNRELRELILRLERESSGNPAAVMELPSGLYESDFTFFARPEACVGQLRDFCWAALGELLCDVNSFPREMLAQLRISSHTWFHVTRKGGWFGHHNHPMASWSGVYCVDSGGDAPALDSGLLTFPNPLPASNVFLDAGNASMRFPYATSNYAQTLKPGQLVLFPSWLGHFVSPYQGEGERITVAFNCWFGAGPR